MDGMLHIDRAPLRGILYAEDFGLPDEPPPPPGPEPGPPPLAAADVQAACDAAVEQARAAWEQSALQSRTGALVALAATLPPLREDARVLAEQAAEGVAQTVLAMLAGILPSLSAAHGDAEVRALLRHVLPTVQTERRLVVRVRPALVPAIEEDLSLLDEEIAAGIKVVPAELPAGDTKVTWEGGSLTRDMRAIETAMLAALAELGLLPSTPNRSLAHAS